MSLSPPHVSVYCIHVENPIDAVNGRARNLKKGASCVCLHNVRWVMRSVRYYTKSHPFHISLACSVYACISTMRIHELATVIQPARVHFVPKHRRSSACARVCVFVLHVVTVWCGMWHVSSSGSSNATDHPSS